MGNTEDMTAPRRPEPTVPGWYPSPAGTGSLTYWDGVGWTDRTRPRGMSAVGLLTLGLVVGVLGWALVAASTGVVALVGVLLSVLGSVITLVGAISYGVAHGLQHAEWRRWD